MRFSTLEQWLAWQEGLHPSAIDLGLQRPGEVLQRLGWQRPDFAVITVAGTNGKGSSSAMLEAILQAAGYRVGCYTSPHILRYNERIRIDGEEVGDESLCEAFERVDQARGDTSITYFEFGTLAAIDLFVRAAVDVAVLEVGMGGRLDAVNLLDADAALVTSVDVDHAAWLGDDREAIGYEKAGVMRSERPAVYGEPNPPASLLAHAGTVGAKLSRLGVDYRYEVGAGEWHWHGPKGESMVLPLPALPGAIQLQNAAAVVATLQALKARLPVSREAIRKGLLTARPHGRFEVLPGTVTRILDVSHNPQAVAVLADNLQQMGGQGALHAVVGMLQDKDLANTLHPLQGLVSRWYLASLEGPRAASAGQLAQVLEAMGVEHYTLHGSVAEAQDAALAEANPGDRLLIFGSFYTVAAALDGPV